jgi:hypothetical protein
MSCQDWRKNWILFLNRDVSQGSWMMHQHMADGLMCNLQLSCEDFENPFTLLDSHPLMREEPMTSTKKPWIPWHSYGSHWSTVRTHLIMHTLSIPHCQLLIVDYSSSITHEQERRERKRGLWGERISYSQCIIMITGLVDLVHASCRAACSHPQS